MIAKAYEYTKVIKYTGSNSAEIASTIGGTFTITSESGGVLNATSCGNTHVVQTGDWLAYDHNCVIDQMTQSQFDARMILVGANASASAFGSANIPALLLGASTTINVTISPTQASTNFTPKVAVVGTALAVGGLNITGFSVVSASVVSVTVRASVAYLGGAQVLVTV